MKIAIPADNGRLHGHFGGAREFALVEIDDDKKLVVSTQILAAPAHKPGLFPLWLRELGVRTVVAGGIGRPALAHFSRYGISVRAGAPGAPLESVVADCLSGKLTGPPQGCDNHGEHPSHGNYEHHGCS